VTVARRSRPPITSSAAGDGVSLSRLDRSAPSQHASALVFAPQGTGSLRQTIFVRGGRTKLRSRRFSPAKDVITFSSLIHQVGGLRPSAGTVQERQRTIIKTKDNECSLQAARRE
jgi:hypothetical protein